MIGVTELDILLSSLPKVEAVDLSYSGLSVVTRNDAHYVNPDFYVLSLASCNLTVIPPFLRAMKKLQVLDLSGRQPYIGSHSCLGRGDWRKQFELFGPLR
ncbi:putative leucine-rich repeat domain superfamily [Helianthus anomalus]